MFEEAEEKPERKPLKVLPKLGVDLVEKAKQGKIYVPIGREREIEEAMRILNRKNKNNPCLVGDPGVGKTAIVEGIACMIATGDCPDSIADRRIFEVSLTDIMAEGDIPKTVKSILKELEDNPDVIIFIDEVHMVMTQEQLANGFKPAMARGNMRLIGATTLNEFRQYIEKDGALERRFQKVMVEEPSIEDCIKILIGIKEKFEDYHGVRYEDEAVIACVKLSARYVKDKYLPDKAIDLMDEIGAKIRTLRPSARGVDPRAVELENQLADVVNQKNRAIKAQQYGSLSQYTSEEGRIRKELEELNSNIPEREREVVTKKMVEEFAAKKFNLPGITMEGDDKRRAKELAKNMKGEIIGQDQQIDQIAKVIKRNFAGFRDPNRPVGTFLLCGTTGVGKTFTVKKLAEHLTGDATNYVRFDMSEFKAPHQVARLIGSPPGYVGYGKGGELTNKVKDRPNSIILFDEIEKADPSIFDILLQVFDDGRLTDGEGRIVDFTNTTIFMTSNLGASAITKQSPTIGFGSRQEESQEQKVKSSIREALMAHLRPEFINRIDEIIIFNPLPQSAAMSILDVQLKDLTKRLQSQEFTVTFGDNIKSYLVQQGFDPQMGARPMRRAVQSIVESPLSDYILDNEDVKVLHVDYDMNLGKVTINDVVMNERKRHIIRSFRLFS